MDHKGPICNLRKMNFYKGTCKVFDIISHRKLALHFIFYSGKVKKPQIIQIIFIVFTFGKIES